MYWAPLKGSIRYEPAGKRQMMELDVTKPAHAVPESPSPIVAAPTLPAVYDGMTPDHSTKEPGSRLLVTDTQKARCEGPEAQTETWQTSTPNSKTSGNRGLRNGPSLLNPL